MTRKKQKSYISWLIELTAIISSISLMFNLTLNGAITIEQMVIGVILLLVIFRFSNDVFNLVATLLGFAAFLLPMLGYDLRKLGILSIYMIPFFMSIIGIYIMIGGFRKK